MGWIQELDTAMDKRPLLKWLVYPTLIILIIGSIAFAYVFIKAAIDGRGVSVSTGSIAPKTQQIKDTTSPLTSVKQEPLPVYKKVNLPAEKNKISKKQVKEPIKSDSNTGSKYNLQSSTFNSPTVIGDNNTQNNFGDIPRIITKEQFSEFFKACPDKNTRVAVDFIGLSANKEMINVKEQIINILKQSGYTNIGMGSGYHVLKEPTSEIGIRRENDGSFMFMVPPK